MGLDPLCRKEQISNYVCSADTDPFLTSTIAPALSSPNKNDTYALKMMIATLNVPLLIKGAATFIPAVIFGFHRLAEYAFSLLGEVFRGRGRGRTSNDNWFVVVFFHGVAVDLLNGVMRELGDGGSQCLIFSERIRVTMCRYMFSR
jgi:hypothetical protein